MTFRLWKWQPIQWFQYTSLLRCWDAMMLDAGVNLPQHTIFFRFVAWCFLGSCFVDEPWRTFGMRVAIFGSIPGTWNSETMIGRINFPIIPRLNLDRVDLAGFSVYPCGWVWDYKRLSGCDVCSEEISLNSEKIPYKMKFETDFGKELAWCETKCKTHCGHPFWYQMTRFIIGINLWVFAILVCYFRGPVFSKYAPREAETKKTIGISMVASYDLCIDLPRKSQKFQKVGQFGMTIGNNFRNIGTILWFAILDLNLLSTCIVCSSIKHILDKFFSIKICSFCLKGKIETTIIGTQRFFQKCHPLFVGINNFKGFVRVDEHHWKNETIRVEPWWTRGFCHVLPCCREGKNEMNFRRLVVCRVRHFFQNMCEAVPGEEWQEMFGFRRVRMLHFQNAKQFPGSAVWDVRVSWRKLGISGTQGDVGDVGFGTFESKVSDPNCPIRFRYVWCSAWKLGG